MNMKEIQHLMKDNNKEINKKNAPIFKKISEWEKNYAKASSWLGKWYCHLQLEKWKKKLHKYE